MRLNRLDAHLCLNWQPLWQHRFQESALGQFFQREAEAIVRR